jgi:hypothetical protein
LTSTWNEREQKILEVVARFEEDDEINVGVADLAKAAGLDFENSFERGSGASGRRLHERRGASTLDGYDLLAPRLLERGRRAIGQWPSEQTFEAFLHALDEQIVETEDPLERSRLEKLRAAAADVGKGVLGAVLTAIIKQQTGLH